jgi:hypothetical protein
MHSTDEKIPLNQQYTFVSSEIPSILRVADILAIVSATDFSRMFLSMANETAWDFFKLLLPTNIPVVGLLEYGRAQN